MSGDVYLPPEADLTTVEDNICQEFYVVGAKKFIVLFMMTMGFYSVYWFYKNWQQYKLEHDDDSWPVARAIFSIFFVHSLFSAVESRLNNLKRNYVWSPQLLALVYIVLVVINRISERMSIKEFGEPYVDIAPLLTIPLIGYVLYQAQMAINEACNDVEGDSNNHFTGLNYAWMTLGALLWVMMLLGLFMIFTQQV